jgi:2-polyprenyl-3-methyl-5-hydroxy-6-metoxy-1,4-benzoquinol methylase
MPIYNNIKKHMNCTICQKKSSFYKTLEDVELYYCKNCNHRFTDNNSIKKKENYSKIYFNEKRPNWFKNPDTNLFNYLYKIIINYKLNSSIIDIGCGNAALLKYLYKKTKKFNLEGIDHFKNKSKNIKFYSGDIFKKKIKKKYDIVISVMVIEHIWNLDKFLKEQIKLCKRNGLIINVTINENSFLYKIARFLNIIGYSKAMNMLYEKHHLNHFSKNSLECLHKKYQLKIIRNEESQFNIDSLTLPKNNFLIISLYKSLLLIIFQIEKIFGEKNQQTLIAKRI